MDLKNLVVLVTGGVSGLGAATARRLLAAGACGVAAIDVDAAKGQAFVAEAPVSVGQQVAEGTLLVRLEAAEA